MDFMGEIGLGEEMEDMLKKARPYTLNLQP
jgi:hypothetical protein